MTHSSIGRSTLLIICQSYAKQPSYRHSSVNGRWHSIMKRQITELSLHLLVGDNEVKPWTTWNFRVYFESTLSFKTFINKTAANAIKHIRTLAAIRDHLTQELTSCLCPTLAISRHDYATHYWWELRIALCAVCNLPWTLQLALFSRKGGHVMPLYS